MRQETIRTWVVKIMAILLAFLMIATGFLYIITR